MDILINDESLDGQFESVDEFIDCIYENTIQMMKYIEQKEMDILKSQCTYDRMVTKEKKLYDLFQLSNSPELQFVKRFLVARLCEEPYWESDLKTNKGSQYLCAVMKQEIPNCITECLEREGVLLSFAHQDFKEESIEVKKDGNDNKVRNALKLEMLVKHGLEKGAADIIEYISSISCIKKIAFYEKGGKCYAREALCDNNLQMRDWLTIAEDIQQMIQNVMQGIRSRFSKQIVMDDISFYEFRTTVSDGREFRLFYVFKNQEICFLNGLVKKTNKTPKKDLELAKKLVKEM